MGFNPGAFVQGHQAGVDVVNAQEEMKMKKALFYQQHQLNQQSIDINNFAIEKAEEASLATKRVQNDMQRLEISKSITSALKAQDSKTTEEALEAINMSNFPILKGEILSPVKDVDAAVRYLDKSGKFDQFNVKPYIIEADGKIRTPNELNQSEMLQAYENAQNMKKQIAQEFIAKGHLITNTKGDVVGLDDLGGMIGLGSRPQFNQYVDQVYAGLRDKLPDMQQGGFEAKSAFGKFVQDMSALGMTDMEEISKYYQDTEKQPLLAIAVSMMNRDNVPLTPENIDRYVKGLKGTMSEPAGSGKTTAPMAYDRMIENISTTLGKEVADMKGKDVFMEMSTLPQEQQGRMKAYAKEFFKESGEKLMDTTTLSKHLHTLKELDNISPDMMESIKSASGMTDAAANKLIQYWGTDKGVEFTRQFKQTFNNLLSTSSKGHISNAELTNLQDAFGSLFKDDKVVFNNFRSMVNSMYSQVAAYETTAPIAGNVLYGQELRAYEAVLDTMEAIQKGSDKTTVTVNGKETSMIDSGNAVSVGEQTFNFGGGE